MPCYKLVPEHNGIEIYFDEKPTNEICSKLKTNGFRWHRVKKCWFAKVTPATKKIADEMCKRTSASPIKQTQVSFTQNIADNFVSTVTITKSNGLYKVASTNNQIICCDCNRFFSIHAMTCPFCGCPLDYVIKTYFEKFKISVPNAKTQPPKDSVSDLKRHRINLMIKEYGMDLSAFQQNQLLKLDLSLFNRAFEHSKSLYLNKKLPEVIEDKFNLILSTDEEFSDRINRLEIQHIINLQEQKIEELKRQREREEAERLRKAELENIMERCKSLGIPQSIIYSKGFSFSEFEERVDAILYYQKQYPNLKIDLSHYITRPLSDLSEFIKRSAPTEKRKDCFGDCSLCRREKCLLDEQ